MPILSPADIPDIEEARRRLLDLIRERSVRRGRFRLSSGREATAYVDLRRVTTHPEAAFLCALLLIDLMRGFRPDAAGGPTLGADPLAGSLGVMSHILGVPLRTFIVRSDAKEHGTGRLVEGSLEPGDRTLVLDDVATSGASLLRAAEAVASEGATVVGVLAILDREAGAAQAVAAKGIPFRSLFTMSEVMEGPIPGAT